MWYRIPMNYKIYTVPVLVLAAILASVAGYFIFKNQPAVPEVSVPSTSSATSTSELPLRSYTTFSTDLSGYTMTCGSEPLFTISKQINGTWEKILPGDLPPAGLYYLDNAFVGYGMNDYRVCTDPVCVPVPKFTTQLLWHEKVGMKAPPADSGSSAATVPVYATNPITGEIKVDITYFSDKDCKNKKTFSTTVTK